MAVDLWLHDVKEREREGKREREGGGGGKWGGCR